MKLQLLIFICALLKQSFASTVVDPRIKTVSTNAATEVAEKRLHDPVNKKYILEAISKAALSEYVSRDKDLKLLTSQDQTSQKQQKKMGKHKKKNKNKKLQDSYVFKAELDSESFSSSLSAVETEDFSSSKSSDETDEEEENRAGTIVGEKKKSETGVVLSTDLNNESQVELRSSSHFDRDIYDETLFMGFAENWECHPNKAYSVLKAATLGDCKAACAKSKTCQYLVYYRSGNGEDKYINGHCSACKTWGGAMEGGKDSNTKVFTPVNLGGENQLVLFKMATFGFWVFAGVAMFSVSALLIKKWCWQPDVINRLTEEKMSCMTMVDEATVSEQKAEMNDLAKSSDSDDGIKYIEIRLRPPEAVEEGARSSEILKGPTVDGHSVFEIEESDLSESSDI